MDPVYDNVDLPTMDFSPPLDGPIPVPVQTKQTSTQTPMLWIVSIVFCLLVGGLITGMVLWLQTKADYEALEGDYKEYKKRVQRFADLQQLYYPNGNVGNNINGTAGWPGTLPNYAYTSIPPFGGGTQVPAVAANPAHTAELHRILSQPTVPRKLGDWTIQDETSDVSYHWNIPGGTQDAWTRVSSPYDRTVPKGTQVALDFTKAKRFIYDQRSAVAISPPTYDPLFF